MRRPVRRIGLVLVGVVCLVGLSPGLASATNGTFVPSSSGTATNGSGSASVTYSSDASGAGALDARAAMTNPDPTATAANADAGVGGLYQIAGNFRAGSYEATTTLSHVDATAQATGSGSASAQFDPSVYCYPCTVTDATVDWIVATPSANVPSGAPTSVRDATFTIQIFFTLSSARSSIEVGGVTSGQASSTGAEPTGNLDFGTGEVQFTGTITHVSVHALGG